MIHILTVIFATLKLAGVIDWPWIIVVSPTVFPVVIYLTLKAIGLIK